MKKQSSIEWLVDYIKNLEKYPYKTIQELEEQAKAMHKEEIKEAWYESLILSDYISGNQYYNKTFKK